MSLQDDDNSYSFASFFSTNRFINAESWWVASELTRRHPELIIYEMHPGGGQYDVLCVTTPDQLRQDVERAQPRVMLNRSGTVQIHEGPQTEVVATWTEVLNSAHPHSLVKELEARTGWGSPNKAPSSTSRVLTYRLMASSLQALVNDRVPWDIRCDAIDSSGGDSTENGFINQFPGASALARQITSLGIYGEPQSFFWALLRGKEPVALFSIGGDVLTKAGISLSIKKKYLDQDRSMRKVTAALLELCE